MRGAGDEDAKRGAYALIDLDYRAVRTLADVRPRTFQQLAPASSTAPIDLIGPGDTLSISIFEPGSNGLFSGYRSAALAVSPETLPHAVVDRNGAVLIPYVGPVKVAGLDPTQAGVEIAKALKSKAVDPQVVVSVTSNLANAVTVIGEVRAPGRYPLTANGDRLLDIVAVAGGPSRQAGDIDVVLVRSDQTVTAPLQLLMEDPSQNIRLAPRDQVRLMYRPRTYSTFGAMTQTAQINIESERLTLAGAISRSGGLQDTRADPSSVFLFRFENPEVAQALGVKTAATPKGVPIVYRLKLSDPASYFLANSIEMRGDDLIYVANANVVEMKKFFEFVQSMTRVVYDIRVTSVLGD